MKSKFKIGMESPGVVIDTTSWGYFPGAGVDVFYPQWMRAVLSPRGVNDIGDIWLFGESMKMTGHGDVFIFRNQDRFKYYGK